MGSNHMGPAPAIAALKKAHIPVLELDSPTTLQQLETNITLLASRLHAESAAQELIEQLQTRRAALLKNSRHKPTVVFLLDIGERGLSQAGTDTTGDALIKLLGGKNISQFSGYKSISVEALWPSIRILFWLVVVLTAWIALTSSSNVSHYCNIAKRLKNNQIVSVNAATLIAGLSLGALAEAERLADKLY
nr:ABC transporter substrate-binding protein [Shewanella glacialipiscicola]